MRNFIILSYSIYVLNLIGVDDIYKLRDSLRSQSGVKGALLDTYVAGYYKDIFSPENGFRIADIIDKTPAYGLSLHGQDYNTSGFRKCFLRYMSLSLGEVVKIIQSMTSTIKVCYVFFANCYTIKINLKVLCYKICCRPFC